MQILRRGSRGSAVKQWQFFLIGQQFEAGPTDGIFGPKTEEATKAFQRKNRLDDDGIVGNKTYGAAMLVGFEGVRDPQNDEKSGPNYPPKPDFPPLVGTAARQRIFGKFRYVHDPVSGNPERIRVLDNWGAENIVSVEIPQLAGVRGAPRSGKIWFHRMATDQLVALWQEWEDAGLLPLVLTWAGSYVPRFIRGSRRTLSNHAFGTAFDINVPWNFLGALPALVGQKGSVRELVPIAHKHGFYWGGHFTRKDGMHFEVAKVLS